MYYKNEFISTLQMFFLQSLRNSEHKILILALKSTSENIPFEKTFTVIFSNSRRDRFIADFYSQK